MPFTLLEQDSSLNAYKRLAKKYDLVITGGSDCHGERKPDVKLGSTKIDDGLVDKIKERHDNLVGVLS